MSDKTLIEIQPVALIPTPSSCALFLGDGQKVICIHVDPSVGASINMVLFKQRPERPLTHDLTMMALKGMGAIIQKVILSSKEGEIFFASLFLQAENEIMHKKFIEIDARPSDAVALAVRENCPIYAKKALWDSLPDEKELLESLDNEQLQFKSDSLERED